MPEDLMDSDHLLPTDLAAWLAVGPAAPVAPRVHAHLVECEVCRGEAVEVSRLVRANRRPGRRTWLRAGTGLAVAAGLALAVLLDRPSRTAPPDIVRSSTATATLRPIAPLSTMSLASGPVTFTWHPAAGAVEYRLTLLDASGSVIWNHVTTDTVVILPLAISLVRNTSYYWYVDALQSNGESTTSRSREFQLSP